MTALLDYITPGVAKVTLSRPERKNAVNFEMIERLTAIFDELRQNNELSVVWIQGEGEAFCSGGDLSEFHNLKTSEEAKQMLIPMSQVLKKIAALDAITLSYLTGPAVGGGAEIASATDFAFGNAKAKAGFVQAKLAITSGWGGASLLKKRIGHQHALYMLGTARIYPVEKLLETGFLYGRMNTEEDIYDWCMRWHQNKEVLRAYKQYTFSDSEREKMFASMDLEVEECARLWESEEHHEAVRAFTGGDGK